jgi:hypothetical protein
MFMMHPLAHRQTQILIILDGVHIKIFFKFKQSTYMKDVPMSSHHFPRTHRTLAHRTLLIDLAFFFLLMMPFKNGKKTSSYKHSIKLKIIFVFS